VIDSVKAVQLGSFPLRTAIIAPSMCMGPDTGPTTLGWGTNRQERRHAYVVG